MSDLPPRYYCRTCEAAIPNPNFGPRGTGTDATCPSCHSPVHDAPATACALVLWCPRCQRIVATAQLHIQGGAQPSGCPSCASPLAQPLLFLHAPMDPVRSLDLGAAVARQLVNAGALDAFAALIAEADTPLFRDAAEIAEALLQAFASLSPED